MAKLLIVDDEDKIRTLIKKYALFEGYEVVEAANGFEAIAKCANMRFDLILMDIMMPELDGYSAVREIRKTSQTPIIMLSAKGEEYDRIHGFELGVDDYVVKPFSVRELMMRIGAVIKRSQGSDLNEFIYQGLKISFSARTVSVDGEKLHLSPKEYDLLFYLVKNKGIALSREQCLSTVWGYDFYGDDRTLDTHIKTLRKSLGSYGSCIVTCRGVGYRFEADE